MKAIVAVDKNWGIGKNNDLLISIPDDMKFFREKTLNKTLILGRKNLESFPGKKPLKNRKHILLTKNKNYKSEDMIIVNSVEEALDITKDIPRDEVFVVGGQKVYEDFLDYCDILYITKIDKDFEAEKFFPNVDELENWKLIDESKIYDYNGIKYQFTKYKNMK